MAFLTQTLSKQNLNLAIEAILPYEHSCVNLADCLRRQKKLFNQKKEAQVFTKSTLFFITDEKTPDKPPVFAGIIALTTRAVLLHCFPKPITEEIERFLIKRFLHNTSVICIMGGKTASQHLENLLNNVFQKKTRRAEDYYLMELRAVPANNFYETACKNLAANLKIVKPDTKEAEKLCPMEMNYMQDEVLAEGEKPSQTNCKELLRLRAKHGLLAAVKKDSVFIAKAAINASGFCWKQIGGVYTLPAYRNCGVAAALVCSLIILCDEKKTNAALFVKVKNYAAQRLYKKIGFIKTGEFKIVYF